MMKNEDAEKEFKCFVCGKDAENLEVLAEDDARIYVICAACRAANLAALLANKTLKDL